MFAVITVTLALSNFFDFSFDSESSFLILVVLPALLDLIGLSVWFKIEFDYVPPFKNLFLALFIVGLVAVVGDILNGSIKLHHVVIPSIFYALSRISSGYVNLKTISKLVVIFSLPFAMGYSAWSLILHLHTFQAFLWIFVLAIFSAILKQQKNT